MIFSVFGGLRFRPFRAQQGTSFGHRTVPTDGGLLLWVAGSTAWRTAPNYWLVKLPGAIFQQSNLVVERSRPIKDTLVELERLERVDHVARRVRLDYVLFVEVGIVTPDGRIVGDRTG